MPRPTLLLSGVEWRWICPPLEKRRNARKGYNIGCEKKVRPRLKSYVPREGPDSFGNLVIQKVAIMTVAGESFQV